jgi:hypothetical protein
LSSSFDTGHRIRLGNLHSVRDLSSGDLRETDSCAGESVEVVSSGLYRFKRKRADQLQPSHSPSTLDG